jgi:serine/threonine protein kinase/tetratricopeptide (TPR) repeat protein
LPGELILHYRVIERLGQGGMGRVFLAEDTKLQRLVALKFPMPGLLRTPAVRQRFLSEARAASALNHPNICTIHAVEELHCESAVDDSSSLSETPSNTTSETMAETIAAAADAPAAIQIEPQVLNDTLFIVMEYVRGAPLAARIAGGPVDPAECLDVALQIARGLHEAHARGIVHRDITPNNVMLSGGLVKIMDFGLARLADDEHQDVGAIVGTPAYMSPEQIAGQPVDPRTDLFSLGVVLYELATGQRPFAGRDLQTLSAAIAYSDPMAPSELGCAVPRAFEKVVMRCLRKSPAERYQSAADVLDALSALKDQSAEAAVARKQQTDRRHKRGADRESERRPATIMFGQMRPPAGSVDSTDEDSSQEIGELVGMVTDLVVGCGGTVDGVVGGSFTALFGLPTAAEGSTRRALNAAIAIRNALRDRNQTRESHRRFALRLGINTGTVVAGGVGTADDRKYSVLGNTVEVAAQLRDAAPDGHIYVGPQTERYARDGFVFVPVAPVLHHEARVPVFELVSDRPVDAPVSVATTGSSADLIGRVVELDRLHECFRALDTGRGSLASITGEPGVGKSRLVAELLRRESESQALVLQGRTESTGANLGYHPIIHMLKGWAGVRSHDDGDAALQKLERLVSEIAPGEAGELCALLATMMGLSLSGTHARRVQAIEGDALARLILKSVRTLIETAAAARPIVVVIEDLHWADQSSVELIEKLFRSAQHHPILFIITCRPDYEQTSGRVLDTIRTHYSRFHVDIDLQPLDGVQSSRLLQALLDSPEFPVGVSRAILQRAGGNPLFIEEVVRSLVGDGTIEIVDGAIRVTHKVGEFVVPETIQELLVARVDLLHESTRSLLKVASVIGATFLHRILEIVAPSPELLDSALRDLIDAQLIRRGERSGEVEYAFNHALTQESVYETLVPRARRDLHLRVAAAIEQTCAPRLNEFYGMLALHYSRAENHAKAEEYLTKAGAEAIKATASSEAIHYFKDALELYLKQPGAIADPERTAYLERNIGLAYYNKGQMVDAVAHFDRALVQWGAGVPTSSAGRVGVLALDASSLLTRLYVRRGQPARRPDDRENDIIELMFRKGTAIVSLDSRRYFAESLSTLRRINRFDITTVRQGAAIYATASSVFSIAAISFTLSRRILDYTRPFIDGSDPKTLLYHRFPELMLEFLVGNWKAVVPYDPQLVEANAKVGEAWFLSVYLVVTAMIQIGQGRYADAASVLGTLGEIAEAYENDLFRARRHLCMTRLLLKQQQLDLAVDEARRGVALLRQIDHPLLLLYMYGLKANVDMHRGDWQDAEQTLREAARVRTRLGRVPPYYVTSYLVAQLKRELHALETALAEGDAARAAGIGRAARPIAREAIGLARKNASDLPETLRVAGALEWVAGREAAALVAWDRSRIEAERMGASPELGRTFFEVARRLETSMLGRLWNGLGARELYRQAADHGVTGAAPHGCW